ncbi:MAG: GWxTD domain-containing protein [Owenweeksia sp.]
MKKAAFFLAATCLLINHLFGSGLGLDVSYAQYQSDDNLPYLELYFALNGQTLTFIKQANESKFTGGVEVTVVFKKDSTIQAADRFRILASSDDTSKVQNVFIQQERFLLDPGTYTLVMELEDIHDSTEHYTIDHEIKVRPITEKASASDFLMLDSYKPASEKNKYAKSGYELIPMVSSGSYYFPENIDKLSFYLELYNLDQSLGEGESYLLKYYIESSDNGQALDKYASFAKKQASGVQPVLASFSIGELPTGNYNLVVEALSRQSETVIQKKEFFFRRNGSVKPLLLSQAGDLDITGTFVDGIDDFDSIYTYMSYLQPISNDAERNYQKSLLESRDKSQMKRYFYVFWQNINSNDPAGEWNRYHTEVKIANKLYGTRIQKGYKTSRGRVYLQYGRPDMVDDRRFEPALPPYQIWQYNQIDSKYVINQTNRFFVFAEFDRSTNDYELIHSTALGELFDSRWKYTMANRGAGGVGPDIDSRSDDISQDSPGSRLNNNMIFKSRSNSNPNW